MIPAAAKNPTSPFRRVIRALKWPALVVIALNLENVAAAVGADKLLLEWGPKIVAFFQIGAIQIFAWLVIGAAAALWVDSILRKRSAPIAPPVTSPRESFPSPVPLPEFQESAPSQEKPRRESTAPNRAAPKKGTAGVDTWLLFVTGEGSSSEIIEVERANISKYIALSPSSSGLGFGSLYPYLFVEFTTPVEFSKVILESNYKGGDYMKTEPENIGIVHKTAENALLSLPILSSMYRYRLVFSK